MSKLVLGAALIAVLEFSASAADLPWPFEIEGGEPVLIQTSAWLPQDDGSILFTCRLEARAERLLSPVSHLYFEGLATNDEGEQVVAWQRRERVLRTLFRNKIGKRVSAFLRVSFDSLPSELDKVVLRFVNEPPESE